MAATHTFIVTSNSFTPGVPGPDPLVTVIGTVDTIPSSGPVSVTVTLWKSAYDQAAAIGIPALEALVAPLMLAQAQANKPPAPQAPVNQITGTFTQ